VGEGVGAQFLDHLGRRLGIEYAGLDPWQGILQRVVDNVWQVARREGRGRPGAEIGLGHRDHLHRDAGLLLECRGQLFLLR
jgi:hypothetical protein